jgi:hypothetical protein
MESPKTLENSEDDLRGQISLPLCVLYINEKLLKNVATLPLGSRPRQRELQGCGPKESPGVKPKGSLGAKAKKKPET